MEGVGVSRHLSTVDNWINTREISATATWHAPEGIGSADKQSHRSGDEREGLHRWR